mmetsp:Transcript_12567/g.13982  ORF Transcript_12567/g.13982 Transcript_12567/m.13982 type:complete len:81 (-) Transcript_12567:483-725(-)
MNPRSKIQMDNEHVTFEMMFGNIVSTEPYNNELPTNIRPMNKGEEALTSRLFKLRGRKIAQPILIQKNTPATTVTNISVQ